MGKMIKTYWLVLLVYVIANSALATPARQLLNQLDLQRGLFADQYQSLQIGNQTYLYLLQENHTAITRGVAVLVADTGKSIASIDGFKALADELNTLGWVTFIIPAPAVAFNELALPSDTADSTGTDTDTDTDTTESTATEQPINADVQAETDGEAITGLADDLDANQTLVSHINQQEFALHEQQMIALLNAAKQQADNYPGFFLVISQGTSAAWLTKIYAQEVLPAPDAFVTISPFWPDRKFNPLLAQWLATTSMPVLDLYNQWDNDWAMATVQQREIAARKALKLQYRQRQLLGVENTLQNSRYLSKEIYGWLTYMGW